jgi:hypothetical protein
MVVCFREMRRRDVERTGWGWACGGQRGQVVGSWQEVHHFDRRPTGPLHLRQRRRVRCICEPLLVPLHDWGGLRHRGLADAGGNRAAGDADEGRPGAMAHHALELDPGHVGNCH